MGKEMGPITARIGRRIVMGLDGAMSRWSHDRNDEEIIFTEVNSGYGSYGK